MPPTLDLAHGKGFSQAWPEKGPVWGSCCGGCAGTLLIPARPWGTCRGPWEELSASSVCHGRRCPTAGGAPRLWGVSPAELGHTRGFTSSAPEWAQTPPAGMCPWVCPWGCWEGSLPTAGSFSSSSAWAARAAALWETPLFPSLNDALAEFFIFPPVTHRNSCAELPPPPGLPSHPAGDTQLLPGCGHSRLSPASVLGSHLEPALPVMWDGTSSSPALTMTARG